jgi:hypothetical protein
MLIFVLTANYELRVSRKSHLRDHPTYGPLSSCRNCGTILPGFILQLVIFRHNQIRELFAYRPRWCSGILPAYHAGTASSNPGGVENFFHHFYWLFIRIGEEQRSCDVRGGGAQRPVLR